MRRKSKKVVEKVNKSAAVREYLKSNRKATPTQIVEAMKEKGMTKTAMAQRMHTDRRQLDRLLDPENPSVTLGTLRRAASAVGKRLRIELA